MDGSPLTPQHGLSYAHNNFTLLSTLLSTLYQIPMAYFDDTNFYPTSYTSGELAAYPVLTQTSATEEADVQASRTFVDDWSAGGYPGYAVGSPRSLRAEASFGKRSRSPLDTRSLTRESPESATSVPSYGAQTHSHGEVSFPEYYWPITGQYAQSYHSSIVGQDNSFANTLASETSMVVPTPSSGKQLSPMKPQGTKCSPIANSTARPLGGQ